MTDLAELVRAAGADLDRLGWTTADAFPEVRAQIERRKTDGMSARLGFTFSQPEVSSDPSRSWPWAQSIVVGLRTYLPDAGTPGSGARIARFAERNHYEPLRAAMKDVAQALVAEGHRAEVVIDDSRLVDRAVAHRAGLAWWGKNTMLLTPGLGPWFLIGCVVTDAVLESGETMRRDCGTCEACLPACPTGALVAPGVLDARRCLAAILQSRGSIPLEFREAVGDRLYGCDDCLDACPPGSRLLAASTEERGSVDPVEVLTAGDRVLLDRYGHFYLPDGDPRYLRRNALVVLGNTGTEDDLILLAGYLMHPDAMLVSHALWAIRSIGGAMAQRILDHHEAASVGS